MEVVLGCGVDIGKSCLVNSLIDSDVDGCEDEGWDVALDSSQRCHCRRWGIT